MVNADMFSYVYNMLSSPGHPIYSNFISLNLAENDEITFAFHKSNKSNFVESFRST